MQHAYRLNILRKKDFPFTVTGANGKGSQDHLLTASLRLSIFRGLTPYFVFTFFALLHAEYPVPSKYLTLT